MSEDDNGQQEPADSLDKGRSSEPDSLGGEAEKETEGQGSSVTRSVAVQQSFTGPLPPPSVLQGYKEIQADLPERVMSLSENEADHRHRVERTIVNNETAITLRGQWFGLGLALVAFGVASLAIVYGHPGTASVIGGGTVVSLVAVYVIGRLPNTRSGNDGGDDTDS